MSRKLVPKAEAAEEPELEFSCLPHPDERKRTKCQIGTLQSKTCLLLQYFHISNMASLLASFK